MNIAIYVNTAVNCCITSCLLLITSKFPDYYSKVCCHYMSVLKEVIIRQVKIKTTMILKKNFFKDTVASVLSEKSHTLM